MSFGDILGQLMQQGAAASSQTRSRIDSSIRNLGASGGANDVFAQIQGALGGLTGQGGAGGALSGMAEKAKDFLQKEQIGGMSGAQVGGIGALAGALLGGGVGGAARGGALAVLGTLALTALKSAQAKQAGSSSSPEALTVEPHEVAAVTGPAVEKLLVRAMISAAKADGAIDQAEMQKIVGKISESGVTDEEKSFVMGEIAAPVNVQALAAEAATPAQAAEVYAASLIAIDVDSDAERAYLRDLAAALKLDPQTVAQLHQMTGAPASA